MLNMILPLAILKAPMGTKLYLNIIPPALGLLFFLKTRRVNRLFLPLILMLFFGLLRSLSLLDYTGMIRLAQVFCLLSFASMAKNWISLDSLHRIAKVMIYFSLVSFLLEYFFIGHFLERKILGINFYRYHGPIGETNYSAIVITFSTLFLILKKDWLHLLGAAICLVLCASRTAFLVLTFFLFLLFIHVMIKDKMKWVLRGLAIFLCLTPLWIWIFYLFASPELLVVANKFSSGRVMLFIPYIKMGISEAFGVGYFNGWDRFEEFLNYFFHIKTGQNVQLNEQHNIFLQVFSEFGILFYPLWCWQILKCFWQETKSQLPGIVLMTLLFGFSLLNGLNEFILYLAFAWMISESKLPNTSLKGLFRAESR